MYGLKKTKYVIVNMGSDQEKEITEQIEARKIGKTSQHKYLGRIVNEKGDLEDYIEEKSTLSAKLLNHIKSIGLQPRVVSETQRVQLTGIFNLLISTPYYSILMKTGIWPVECRTH